MKTPAQMFLDSRVFLGIIGVLMSGIVVACTTEALPTESAELSETGLASVGSDPGIGEQAEVQAVELDGNELVVDDSDAPQFNELTFRERDCGESCGFWVGEHYLTIRFWEREIVDPRIAATIPYEQDKVHEVKLGDLDFTLEFHHSDN